MGGLLAKKESDLPKATSTSWLTLQAEVNEALAKLAGDNSDEDEKLLDVSDLDAEEKTLPMTGSEFYDIDPLLRMYRKIRKLHGSIMLMKPEIQRITSHVREAYGGTITTSPKSGGAITPVSVDKYLWGLNGPKNLMIVMSHWIRTCDEDEIVYDKFPLDVLKFMVQFHPREQDNPALRAVCAALPAVAVLLAVVSVKTELNEFLETELTIKSPWLNPVLYPKHAKEIGRQPSMDVASLADQALTAETAASGARSSGKVSMDLELPPPRTSRMPSVSFIFHRSTPSSGGSGGSATSVSGVVVESNTPGSIVRAKGLDEKAEEMSVFLVSRIWHTLFEMDKFYLAHQPEIMQGVSFLKRGANSMLCGEEGSRPLLLIGQKMVEEYLIDTSDDFEQVWAALPPVITDSVKSGLFSLLNTPVSPGAAGRDEVKSDELIDRVGLSAASISSEADRMVSQSALDATIRSTLKQLLDSNFLRIYSFQTASSGCYNTGFSLLTQGNQKGGSFTSNRRCIDFGAHLCSMLISLLSRFARKNRTVPATSSSTDTSLTAVKRASMVKVTPPKTKSSGRAPEMSNSSIVYSSKPDAKGTVVVSPDDFYSVVSLNFWKMCELLVASMISLDYSCYSLTTPTSIQIFDYGNESSMDDESKVFKYYRSVAKHCVKLMVKTLPEAMTDEVFLSMIGLNAIEYFNELSKVQKAFKYGVISLAQKRAPKSVLTQFDTIE